MTIPSEVVNQGARAIAIHLLEERGERVRFSYSFKMEAATMQGHAFRVTLPDGRAFWLDQHDLVKWELVEVK